MRQTPYAIGKNNSANLSNSDYKWKSPFCGCCLGCVSGKCPKESDHQRAKTFDKNIERITQCLGNSKKKERAACYGLGRGLKPHHQKTENQNRRSIENG